HNFLPLYKEAKTQTKAFTEQNIRSAFQKTGIVPFLSCLVLPKKDHAYPPITHSETSFLLDKTPYTKCQLWWQTNQALSFIKTTSPSQICDLILRFSHMAEYNLMAIDIVTTKMQTLQAKIKIAKEMKKDCWIISRARVITGAETLEATQKADAKKKASAISSRTWSKPTMPHCTIPLHSTPRTCSTIYVMPFTPIYASTFVHLLPNHLLCSGPYTIPKANLNGTQTPPVRMIMAAPIANKAILRTATTYCQLEPLPL
ncbi:hypothetical protein L873DRAFT_1872386, partial [Choiromyces venosus 120613-1]